MVTPLHLLLFGSRKVDWVDGVVRLDNWINLDMDPEVAAMIVALRPALESLVIRASQEPEQVLEMGETDKMVVSTIKELCKLHAGSFEIERNKTSLLASKRPPRGHSIGGYSGPPLSSSVVVEVVMIMEEAEALVGEAVASIEVEVVDLEEEVEDLDEVAVLEEAVAVLVEDSEVVAIEEVIKMVNVLVQRFESHFIITVSQ